MISLFVDTSYKSLFIGLVNDDKLIDKTYMMAEANFSEVLVPSLKELVDKNNLNLSDINKIFVTIGPGSFTGIRIGMTVCKTLGFVLNKKIIPISSLEFMATTKTDTTYKIPFIDARHDKVFAGVYDKNGNCVVNDSYCNLNDLVNDLDGEVIFISYDNLNLKNVVTPDYDVVSIVKKHMGDKELNPHELKPNYLKKTEAEERFND